MVPRIVLRTHYQVYEPAYMEFVVKKCTSPVQSVYPEVVARRLADMISASGKKFNRAAGRYAVDLARALGLITPNNTWTEKGQLMSLIADVGDGELEEELTLSLRERLLHFRVFLEADGGALLYVAQRLVERGSVAVPSSEWNELAKDMFVTVYSDYLAITNNTAERVALRRAIERIRVEGYEGRTGEHKMMIHLQTLYRLGLIVRPDSGGSRLYQLPPTTSRKRGIQFLLEELPSVVALERALKEHQWARIAARVFQIPFTPHEAGHDEDSEAILSLLAPYYAELTSQGIPLCSLSTLIEAAQIDLLASRSELLVHDEAVRLLGVAQKRFPKDVRFHVDRRGNPAFLKLSNTILKQFSHMRVAQ